MVLERSVGLSLVEGMRVGGVLFVLGGYEGGWGGVVGCWGRFDANCGLRVGG